MHEKGLLAWVHHNNLVGLVYFGGKQQRADTIQWGKAVAVEHSF